MRWSSTLLLAATAGFSAAHSAAGQGEHMPQIFGGRKFLSEMRGRRQLEHKIKEARSTRPMPEERASVVPRQGNTSGKCGGTRGSCATGYCCSAEGWCGKGTDYCEAPDCQLSYGSGCDGNKKPSGADTTSIARTKVGKIAYGGVGIYDCVNKGDIAITFDDGPYNYTNDLLDKFQKWGAKATFFITGNNIGKGMINDPALPYRAIIQRAAAEGHQIASHTWSHQNFSQLTTTQFQNQIYWNEIALNDILGYIPTYMRPPFSICESTCETTLANMGYHITYFDLDTEGYLNDDPTLIQTSKDIWDDAVKGTNPCRTSYLNIEHDIHYQTVYNLTDYMLESLFNNGYKSVTVGECLGDPPENWYRAGSSAVPTYTFTHKPATGTYSCLQSSTAAPTTTTTTTTTSSAATPTATLKVSTDGTCKAGITCKGSQYGNCCSVNGWCGASIDYCGTGCQPAFGTCSL